MAGIGFILGGALKGLGDGMAAQAKMSIEDRREAASRAARLHELQVSSDLAGGREAAQDMRRFAADMAKQDDSQAFTAEQNTAAARAAANSQAAKFQFERTKDESDKNFELRKMRLQSALNTNAEVQKIAAQAVADGKKIKDVLTDGETGAVSVIFNDGSAKIASGVIARPKPSASSGDDLLTVGGATAPVTQKPGAGKTTTRAEIAQLAKEGGMTPSQAEQWAKAQGWTIK
jgi:hypothetical protein